MSAEHEPQFINTQKPDRPGATPRLPNERDESPTSQSSQSDQSSLSTTKPGNTQGTNITERPDASTTRPDMQQAHSDIDQGQVDTDLRNTRGVEKTDSKAAGNARQAVINCSNRNLI